MIRYIGTIIFFLLNLSAFAQQQNTVNWLSFEQLSDSLATKPKKVLLFFHTDWCAYCRKMQKVIFTDPDVVNELNSNYYAVQFDAETVDTIHFDGQVVVNESSKKRTGQYHNMAKLLAARDGKLSFPTTLILASDFNVEQRFFQYVDRKKLMKALKNKP
ncbi:thioredoxin family protein [Sphingobacterium gobiense]|uniref:Thioredoxin family protein n=1 Tax=Sphingobacterium gobiense TaxID=1382456 RepID=A0A2S9JEJ0_9SPHI|nr:thioredoxin family protein [Sphingobacterium gobiense]PRD51335.1 hypothetical protein C5749_18140 [Sphingobacterium gobiense]